MKCHAIIPTRKKRKKKKRIAVILDDATSTLSIRKQQRINQDFPMVCQLEIQGREYGICTWVATQEPSLVVSSARNVNVKICMPLSSGADIQEMARSLGLEHDETVRARSLTLGEAIIKVGTREFGCILIDLERSMVDRSITVEEARRKSEALRKKLLSYVKPRSQKLKAILAAEAGAKKQRLDVDGYLVMVAESAGLMISELREKYRLSIQKEMSLRKESIKGGHIEEIEIKLSARGKNPKVPGLTQKGRDRLDALGKKTSHRCRGSVEHIFWQIRGGIFMEKVLGYKASLEHRVDDTSYDVHGINQDKHTAAIEIAMESSYQITNIEKGIKYVDRLIVACKSRKIMENLKAKVIRELGQEVVRKVEFKLVKDLYIPKGNL